MSAAAATAEEAQGEVEVEIDVHQVIDSDLALAVGAPATASSEGAATMDIDAADACEAALYGEIVTRALKGFVILRDVAAAAVDVEARLGQNLSMIILRGAEVGGPAASYMQHRATHKGREWQRSFTSHGGYRLKYSVHAAIPYEPEASFRDFLIR